MRHNKKFNHLGRKTPHRKAMLANMACSLIEHKRINTTIAKAKALRMYVEPLITKSKDDSTSSRRVVFSYLKNKVAVAELFRDVAPKIADREGGYTRILKTGSRLGDGADMCLIELVDFNETYVTEKKKAAKSTRRRGGKKAAPKAEAAPATDALVEDAEVVEETAAPEATPEAKVAEAPEAKAQEAAPEAKAEEAPEAPADDKKEDDSAADEKKGE